MDERREIVRVYIELCKNGSQPISDQNSQMLYYELICKSLGGKHACAIKIN